MMKSDWIKARDRRDMASESSTYHVMFHKAPEGQ